MRTIKMLLTGVVMGMVGGAGGLITLKIAECVTNPEIQEKAKRILKNIKDEFAK